MSGTEDNGDRTAADRLPPPAFPPGRRRRPLTDRPVDASEALEGELPEGALIVPERDGEGDGGDDDVLIPPDAPVVRTGTPKPPEDYEEVMGRISAHGLASGEITVTGMGDASHPFLDPASGRHGDADLARLTAAVERLARELETHGEAGLEARPGMSPFEATLRAYCVGYLDGLREQDSEPETP